MENLLEMNKKFKYTRMITIIALVSLAIISVISILYTNKMVTEYSKRIYVFNKDKKFEALVADINDNREAEGKYHIKRFHELFFTISPDPAAIEANAEKFLYLGDESVYKSYMDLKERGYYNDMISGNINQSVRVDSIQIDMNSNPRNVRTFFTLTETRSSGKRERVGVTTCYIEDVKRTINSPNGYLIRNFKIVKVINTQRDLNTLKKDENETE